MHIDFANTKFSCPHCGKEFDDKDDKFLDACNKSELGIVAVNCCKRFYVTYDIRGSMVAFTMEELK